MEHSGQWTSREQRLMSGSATLPTVSVVVRALNEAEHLPRLLDGFAHQTMQPDEIVLVDSGSTDGTVEIAERAGLTISHIRPGDFTFGRALNQGCEAAKGEILVFVSAHVYPSDTRWLEELLAPFANPRVASVYGRQTGDERTSFSEQQLFESWFPASSEHAQSHPFCNNANCAIRKTWWEQIPYDEALPGLEDIAWANEMQQRGGLLSYAADAAVVHVHEESFRQTLNRYRREALAHRSQRSSRAMNAQQAARLGSEHIVRDIARAVRRRKLDAIPEIVSFRTAQFVGAYLGNRDSVDDHDEVIARMYYPRR